MLVILLALIAGALYAIWLPQLRIQEVHATGPNTSSMEQAARSVLAGTYGYVIPRNSIFFFPKAAMRNVVLAQRPEVAAVSIKRSSFSSVSVSATPRVMAFVWCGVSKTATTTTACYEADTEGLVFKPLAGVLDSASVATTLAMPATGELRVYSPLGKEFTEGTSPVGTRVISAAAIPDALRFVKAIRELGIPVVALELRGDEADLWVNEATRITYVLGREQEAADLAASVIPTLNLVSGLIEYLDLRFSGRAYVKRYGEAVEE